MATLAMPIFLIFSITQPAQAWENQAQSNQGDNIGTLVPKLTLPDFVNHEIQPGDTLWELSQQYEISPETIADCNNIDTEQVLEVGKTLKMPLTESKSNQQLPTPEQPLLAAGGAVSVENSSLSADTSSSQTELTPAMPQVIAQGLTASEHKNPNAMSQLPIQQFLADVEQLRANYQQEPTTENSNLSPTIDRNRKKENQGKVLSTDESSDQPASMNSLATAPIKVEFYNNFLNSPIGESVSPELPPLSPPDQYLPNSPQQFDGYIWPAEGVFTSGYGRRWGRMHRGIDIAAPIGTPIVASAPGKVIVAGWNNGGYGNWVKLKHPDGSITLYAHNSKVLVQKGQKVDQGEPIAEMGSSGRSTGPHLHFEIQRPGKGAVNPIAYLPDR